MLENILNNEALLDILRDQFDLEILPRMEEPENEFGHLTYSIPGKTFARDGSGGEFILLEDGTVGYWGSEGQCGRFAESVEEAVTMIVRCPWWMDILDCDIEDDEALAERIEELQEEYDAEIPEELEVDAEPMELVKRFYESATREPRLVTTYREDDGSTHDSSGSLFEYE